LVNQQIKYIQIKSNQIKPKSNQIKSNQIKSNQIKSNQNQIKSNPNQIKSNQIKSNQIKSKSNQIKSNQNQIKSKSNQNQIKSYMLKKFGTQHVHLCVRCPPRTPTPHCQPLSPRADSKRRHNADPRRQLHHCHPSHCRPRCHSHCHCHGRCGWRCHCHCRAPHCHGAVPAAGDNGSGGGGHRDDGVAAGRVGQKLDLRAGLYIKMGVWGAFCM
jgi:hypothetical protein